MLLGKLQADQVAALKSSSREKVEVLRYLLSRIQNREIEKKSALTDEEVTDILRRQIRELNEANAAFAKGGRRDLVEANNRQIEILKPYLPAEISDEDLRAAVKRLIEENKPAYEANPKSIIGICMRELKSRAAPERIMAAINSA